MIITNKGKMSNYSMEVKGKFLIVTGEGLFSYEDAQSFIDDFRKIVSKNNTSSMELIINTVNLKTGKQDIKPLIEEMSILYRDTVFSKKYMVMPNSAVASMQLKNNDPVGVFTQFTFIDNIETILN